jgi:hypothetical protein
MKRYFLLGLAALGLIALVPTESKADDGFRVYVSPAYQPEGPYYYRDDRYRYYRRHTAPSLRSSGLSVTSKHAKNAAMSGDSVQSKSRVGSL